MSENGLQQLSNVLRASFQPALQKQVYKTILEISKVCKLDVMRNLMFSPFGLIFKSSTFFPLFITIRFGRSLWGAGLQHLSLLWVFQNYCSRSLHKSLPATLSFQHGPNSLGGRLVWKDKGAHSEMGADIPEALFISRTSTGGFCRFLKRKSKWGRHYLQDVSLCQPHTS